MPDLSHQQDPAGRAAWIPQSTQGPWFGTPAASTTSGHQHRNSPEQPRAQSSYGESCREPDSTLQTGPAGTWCENSPEQPGVLMGLWVRRHRGPRWCQYGSYLECAYNRTLAHLFLPPHTTPAQNPQVPTEELLHLAPKTTSPGPHPGSLSTRKNYFTLTQPPACQNNEAFAISAEDLPTQGQSLKTGRGNPFK